MTERQVCPECGKPIDSAPPAFFSDRWIRFSIAAAVVLVLGLVVRILTNETAKPPPVAAPKAQQWMSEAMALAPGATLRTFRDAAQGTSEIHLDVEATDDRPFRLSIDQDLRPSPGLRLGIVRAPFMYRSVQWKLGWPVALVDVYKSSTIWLEESDRKPGFSPSPNSKSLNWLGWRDAWVGADWSTRVQVTWAAVWVAWSAGAIAFVVAGLLMCRARRWRRYAAIAAVLVFVGSVACPNWKLDTRSPMGFSFDQTIDTGITLDELRTLAATPSGRHEFATLIDRLATERFRYPANSEMTTAPIRPTFKEVVMKGKPDPSKTPLTAIPVFFAHEPKRAVLESSVARKSWNLETVTRSDYRSTPEDSAPTSISIGKWGYASLAFRRPDGYTTYSFWFVRLAIELGTMLAIPAAILLLRAAWLGRTERLRERTGACQVCGYDLRKMAIPASIA